jgi:hypothetical protein
MAQTYRQKLLAQMAKKADDLGTQDTQEISMNPGEVETRPNADPTEVVSGLKEHLRNVLAAERQLQVALTGILKLGEVGVTEIRPDMVTPYENVYKHIKAFNMQMQKTVVMSMAFIRQLEGKN